MTITSFYFLTLVIIGVIVYYLIPKAWQWVELLILSLLFYYFAAEPYTIVYLIISTLVAYSAAIFMHKKRAEKGAGGKGLLRLTFFALALNILLWFTLKGKGLWGFFAIRLQEYIYIPQVDAILDKELVAALGMGYYTLQILGYIIDCYWENITPQKNPLKLFLFTAYFPQLTTYIGFYSWIVILLYPLQMYADFSGCMDIILGVSELFDIHLAENFKNPFFARTSQEFWQRWHITLGTWAKDYVLYPLLKSKSMIKFGKFTKKKFGKKTGKFLVNAVGMFILWMVMGIWHGGLRYIMGVSLWYWIILMLGDLFKPLFEKITTSLNMKTESFSWHLFQSCRTYLIYAVGAAFFSFGVSRGLAILQDAWKIISVKDYANPWIFFDGSILDLGVTYGDINIILLIVLMLIIVACLREKYGYARIWIQNQSVGFRWLIWIGLFVIVLIFGKYGPGYNAKTISFRWRDLFFSYV